MYLDFLEVTVQLGKTMVSLTTGVLDLHLSTPLKHLNFPLTNKHIHGDVNIVLIKSALSKYIFLILKNMFLDYKEMLLLVHKISISLFRSVDFKYIEYGYKILQSIK